MRLSEALLMNTTTYVFVEKKEKYQQFSAGKNALSGAMLVWCWKECIFQSISATKWTLLDRVEVLRACEPIRVMMSAVSFPNYTFPGQSFKRLTSTYAHSFARNWQLPFLNQRKGENDRRKYFIINLHERMLPNPAGSNPERLITSQMSINKVEKGPLFHICIHTVWSELLLVLKYPLIL